MSAQDRSTQWVARIAAVLLVALAMRTALTLPPSSFKAFYCAGRATLERADPYRIEPLRSCERRVAPGALPAYAVEPAPLPGYALLPWAALSVMPPHLARAVFLALLLAALIVTSWAVARLAPVEPALALVSLLALWFLNASYGEIPPIATACIAFCAVMLARERAWAAALGAGGAALEPHLAVPLWIALFLFAPKTRGPLLAVGAGLVALDLAAGGLHQAVEYFTQTLPAQALSEVGASDQYSATHAAAIAGADARTALRLGFLSYVAMTVAGLAVARRLAAREGAEFLALVPPAFVLIGGSFVHDIQFVAALPLALVLLGRTAPRPNASIAAATLLLVPAWNEATSRLSLVLSAASAYAAAWVALPRGATRAMAAAGGALSVALLIVALNRLPVPGGVSQAPAVAFRATDQASLAWSAYIAGNPALSKPSPSGPMRHLPTWAGAVLLAVFSARCARNGIPRAATSAERPSAAPIAGPLGST